MPVNVIFIHPDGRREVASAAPGDSVMDCAVDNDIRGIDAHCGGGCTCSTCHCYIDPAWLPALPEQIGDELDLLEYVAEKRSNSRLTCQIFLDESLSGIEVHIPPVTGNE